MSRIQAENDNVQNHPAIAIRVPEKLALKLLDLARQWDAETDPKDK